MPAFSVTVLGALSGLTLTGCLSESRRGEINGDRSASRIIVEGDHFAVTDGATTIRFVPWGFNYDRTVIDGRDVLIEDVLRERPGKIAEDFTAMQRLSGNTVRVLLPIADILKGPDEVDAEGLRRWETVFDAARSARLHVILTGLANIRPASSPAWLREADDETIGRAEMIFWRAVAKHFRSEPAIFAYDLQNEPAVHSSDSDALVEGCFNMSGGQRFCYVHRHYRQVRKRWTEYIHDKFFKDEAALRSHWPDYPRGGESWSSIAPAADAKDPRYREYVAFHWQLLSEWARRLVGVIRSEDSRHLVTVGALDPIVMADAVDFYCLHLYPGPAASGEDFAAANARGWRKRLSALPADKPVIIEEFYPMWPFAKPDLERMLDALLEGTCPRAAGWISFYWGRADELNWPTPQHRRLYEDWLSVWAARAPRASGG